MYVPLSDSIRSPGVGGDLGIMGLYLAGLGSILGSFLVAAFMARVSTVTISP